MEPMVWKALAYVASGTHWQAYDPNSSAAEVSSACSPTAAVAKTQQLFDRFAVLDMYSSIGSPVM